MKILITSGGTREPIDSVRSITNMSTGRTGAQIADYLVDQGHSVTYLHAREARRPKAAARFVEFDTFFDLDSRMKELLKIGYYDAVIHAAAVSDYAVAEIRVGDQVMKPNLLCKLDSQNEIELKLVRNFKIVERIKSYAEARTPLVIAFKLTDTDSETSRLEAVRKLSHNPAIDFVVHNDLREMARDGYHRFRIYRREQVLSQVASSLELAQQLNRILRTGGMI